MYGEGKSKVNEPYLYQVKPLESSSALSVKFELTLEIISKALAYGIDNSTNALAYLFHFIYG